jgi:hypothetical protein
MNPSAVGAARLGGVDSDLSIDLKDIFCPSTLSMKMEPFPLSTGVKPRDLQFRGPFLEIRNTMLKQNCHLDRTRISCHAALDIAACAAFVKESSIK